MGIKLLNSNENSKIDEVDIITITHPDANLSTYTILVIFLSGVTIIDPLFLGHRFFHLKPLTHSYNPRDIRPKRLPKLYFLAFHYCMY
jgi:hypothetical protein